MRPAKKAKSTSKPTARRRTTSISLSARVERLERELLSKPAVAPTNVTTALARYVNLGADGKPTTGDHVAVWDRKTNLVHAAAPLLNGKNVNHADAVKACAALDLLGHTNWRPLEIEEALSIIDYTMFDPAVDKRHFKGPFGLTWTNTPRAARSGAAWVVYLDGGLSFWGNLDLHVQVRAVCAGQQLGLLGIEA